MAAKDRPNAAVYLYECLKKKLFLISEATDVIQLCPLCLYKFWKVFHTKKVSLTLSNHSISSAKSRKRTVQLKFQLVK